MSLNRAEQAIPDRLVKIVAQTARDMRELKGAVQPIGLDVFQVGTIPQDGIPIGTSNFTLAANGTASLQVNFIPKSSKLTLWNFAVTMHIDQTVFNVADIWPDGANITTAKRKVEMKSWLDYDDSDDVTNTKAFKVFVRNNDVSSHDVKLRLIAYQPQNINEGDGYSVG